MLRSIRLIATGNVNDDEELRTRTQEDVFIQFHVTNDNVLMQRWFIRYSNAFSTRSSHRSRPGDANELIIQYTRLAFDSVST